MTLYRPVGQKELDLIAESGYAEFPSRLDWQPIFYPVLHKEYAAQIASEWNTKDAASGYVGYVLEFEVDDAYLSQFPVHTVGAGLHREYWIPSEALRAFNGHISGKIRVIQKYVGKEREPT